MPDHVLDPIQQDSDIPSETLSQAVARTTTRRRFLATASTLSAALAACGRSEQAVSDTGAASRNAAQGGRAGSAILNPTRDCATRCPRRPPRSPP